MIKGFWLLVPHVFTLLLAIGYMLLGGYILCIIEGWASDKNSSHLDAQAKIKLEKLISNDSTIFVNELDLFLDTYYQEKEKPSWTLLEGFLYEYSAVTTIGYSHLHTVTDIGRLFYVFYNLIGIPLCTLVLADWGLLLEEGLSALCRLILTALAIKVPWFRTWSRKKPFLVPAESLFFLPIVLVIFLLYVALGGFLLPLWEHDWTFIQGFYVAFDGITTIGIGDIYPKNNDYFLATLIYMSIGIAIAATAIGAIGDYLRVLHYAGTTPRDCGLQVVWFGGKHMRVEKLTHILGKEFGATEFEIRAVQNRLDLIINRAFEKESSGDKEQLKAGGQYEKRNRRSVPSGGWNDSAIMPLTLIPVQNSTIPSSGSFYGSHEDEDPDPDADKDPRGYRSLSKL